MYGVERLYLPRSIDQALDILSQDPEAIVLAGGTDVLVKMRHNHTQGARLVSLAYLDELRQIRETGDNGITIGPACTFTDIAQSRVIEERLPLLKTAALAMGGPQIQNVATIGGNVCNGATSADSAPSLFALDAELVLARREGVRRVPISEFYAGPGRVHKEREELLTSIVIPPLPRERWGGAYIKFSTRKAMDIATLGAAATCGVDGLGRVEQAAIALGVAGPTPVRCPEAEQLLIGQTPTPELLEEAGRLAIKAGSPRTSWRASKEYREALIRELSMKAFSQAYAMAKGGK